MKKYFLFLLLTPTITFADDSIFDSGGWYLDNYALTTKKHEPFPFNGKTYDHSIYYNMSDGSGSADACEVTSPMTLSCMGGESVTYDSANHSATLRAQFGTFIYYDKNSKPAASPISGVWIKKEGGNCHSYGEVKKVIPYQPFNATVFTDVSDCMIGFCMNYNTYYIKQEKETNKLVLDGRYPNEVDLSSYGVLYFYDANDQPITDRNKLNTVAYFSDDYLNQDPICRFKKEG